MGSFTGGLARDGEREEAQSVKKDLALLNEARKHGVDVREVLKAAIEEAVSASSRESGAA